MFFGTRKLKNSRHGHFCIKLAMKNLAKHFLTDQSDSPLGARYFFQDSFKKIRPLVLHCRMFQSNTQTNCLQTNCLHTNCLQTSRVLTLSPCSTSVFNFYWRQLLLKDAFCRLLLLCYWKAGPYFISSGFHTSIPGSASSSWNNHDSVSLQ